MVMRVHREKIEARYSLLGILLKSCMPNILEILVLVSLSLEDGWRRMGACLVSKGILPALRNLDHQVSHRVFVNINLLCDATFVSFPF